MKCPECSRGELDEVPTGRGTWLTCPACGFKKFSKRAVVMSRKWTPPDDKTIARIRAMMKSDLEEGEPMEKLIDELVTEDGWPKESAVKFVQNVKCKFSDDKAEQLFNEYIAGRYSQEYKTGYEPPHDWWCARIGAYVLFPDPNGIIRYDKYAREQDAQEAFKFDELDSALEGNKAGGLGDSITRLGQSMQDFGQEWTQNITIPLLIIIGIVILGAVCIGAVS